MIRKRYYNVLMCLCVGMMLSACAKNPEHYGVEAKTVYFATLEEMDEYATVIVKATRLEGEKAVLAKQDGYITSGYSYSTVKITEIYKDISGQLQAGDEITLLENEVYDEEENIVYHIAGYNMMVPEEEYLLFLTKNTANGSDYYVSAGVNYGTVSLGEDGRTIQRKDSRGNAVSEFSAYTEIWEAAKEKYIE